MIKKFTLITIIIFIMSSLVVFGKNNIKYEVCESNIKIFLNNNEMKFDLPVFVINGRTYVSLRELAKKLNIKVIWNNEKREIEIKQNMQDIQDFDIYKTFENFFEFKLSDKAKILHYNYSINDEEFSLRTKVLISKEDVEFIKNFVKDNANWELLDNNWNPFANWEPFFDGESIDNIEPLQNIVGRKFYWWDLSNVNETIFAYGNFSKGRFTIKSMISIYLFITQESDDQYYLYALYV